MKRKDFEKLLDKNKYQIFLFIQRFGFAAHSWFVINKKGKTYRIGVWHIKSKGSYIHKLRKDLISPLKVFPVNLFPIKIIHLEGTLEGERAKKMISFIGKNYKNYKFKRRYLLLPGPNCNTFAQSIINEFPTAGFKLPWNSFGKNYCKEKMFISS